MQYNFSANVWLYPGDAAWYFVSLPKKEVAAIEKIVALRYAEGKKRRGFGAVKVRAFIGQTSWETSMFPGKRSGTYILPLKAQIRKKECVISGDTVRVIIDIKNN